MYIGDDFKGQENAVELPAIVVGGMIRQCSFDLLKLSEEDLIKYAKHMGGEVIYHKVDISYETSVPRFCGKKECYRPIPKENLENEILKCKDHMNGSRKLWR